MMRVSHYVASSEIHGAGLFTMEPVRAGTVLWSYQPGVDRRISVSEAAETDLHFGYINPRRPHDLVVCGDTARFWNFPAAGSMPNAIEGPVDVHGEALIVAARDIAAGEELTIDAATDADTGRKLNLNAA